MSTDGAPVITAWTVMSGLGAGAGTLTAGLRSGRSAVTELDPTAWPGPLGHGAPIPAFTVAGALGRKGTRSMDRATGIAVATVGMLLDDPEQPVGPTGRRDLALVLGTGSGSVQSIMDFTRDSLTQDRPYLVDPARFPNTVMNCAAGRCAIRYGIEGPNSTIAAGRLTALHVLRYATRLLRAGHAEAVLCGAVEEFSVQRSWLEWHARPDGDRLRPLGEGCALFLLERPFAAARLGGEPLLRVCATAFRGFQDASAARPALAECVHEALSRSGAGPADVWAVVPSPHDEETGAAQQGALGDVLGAATPLWLRPEELIGDTSAAAGAFQLAAVLAEGIPRPTWGRTALVTAIDAGGLAGCLAVSPL
ncbi:beta-ketoacyl synthase N-terminal-like domain-containing protein [Streptomyces cupreus]|uniref:3-oxoacyl-ACP synthase n=1 Tax=Streptomyces cupreus TaxID=2759956 RepID=A0A7X1J3T2_9ACTN|nr:beta-ketoacyl synthase N-terminal-like domain-containing protein [Streptomyces cupreus]MBC2903693.1 3-oxoacyl-ACP synthase [Streptomyces cupreus]